MNTSPGFEKKLPISVAIIALNEEKDLPRCLNSVSWAQEIIVVDTFSTDKTAEIARQAGAKVIQEKWRGYGAQKNLAIGHATAPWILNLDADEEVTPELKMELARIVSDPQSADGYRIPRRTFFLNQWIRFGGWYPNYVTRFVRRGKGAWSEPQVHEEWIVQGRLDSISTPMNHYTFTDLEDQVRTNIRYARQGADAWLSKEKSTHPLLMVLKPTAKFMECFFFKRGFLDGWAGFVIAVNAAHSMFLKMAFSWEKRSGRSAPERGKGL